MRIRQLDLLKYGHFTNATIDLPTGKPDFQMLLGENEAGKSTTMGGVEDLFFGIPANSPREINDGQVSFDHTALSTLVSRIDVQSTQLVISVKPANGATESELLSMPWQKPPSKRFGKILLPHGTPRENVRPERRARLVSAIARGRRWLTNSSQAQLPTSNNWPNASDARCAKSI